MGMEPNGKRGHPLETDVCENQPTVAAIAMWVGVNERTHVDHKVGHVRGEGCLVASLQSVSCQLVFSLCSSLHEHFILAQHLRQTHQRIRIGSSVSVKVSSTRCVVLCHKHGSGA